MLLTDAMNYRMSYIGYDIEQNNYTAELKGEGTLMRKVVEKKAFIKTKHVLKAH